MRRSDERKAAAAAGLKRFHSDNPCPKGHVGEWFVSGKCCTCAQKQNATNIDWHRQYRAENRDRLAVANKRYREKNAVVLAEKRRAKRLENPAIFRASNLRWLEANREHVRAYHRARYAADPQGAKLRNGIYRARRSISGVIVTAKDVASIRSKQRNRCAYCRQRFDGSEHIDHIVPLARGGLHIRQNIQLLCKPCNLSKGARDPIVHAQTLGLLI